MSSLVRGVYAIARTKRRRFLWCVWWTGEPTEKPFREPDAWGGGAHTEDEARELAERAAGMPLQLIDGRWAGAFKRMRAGMRPFPTQAAPRTAAEDDAGTRGNGDGQKPAGPVNPYVLLGVSSSATVAEIKAAFRVKALEHHPDHGGTPASFIALKRAYDSLIKRRARPQTRGPAA